MRRLQVGHDDLKRGLYLPKHAWSAQGRVRRTRRALPQSLVQLRGSGTRRVEPRGSPRRSTADKSAVEKRTGRDEQDAEDAAADEIATHRVRNAAARQTSWVAQDISPWDLARTSTECARTLRVLVPVRCGGRSITVATAVTVARVNTLVGVHEVVQTAYRGTGREGVTSEQD